MMKNISRIALVAASALLWPSAAEAHLVINELMQSNIDCIKDDLNEFPDSWVELYNPGADAESLGDYLIADSDKLKKAYRLPSQTIAPGEFVVIYCDKADQGLHTDFRLDSGKGGAVYLFKGGEVVDKVENWKKQPAPNIAFGKETETSDKWGYQAVPTPGAANCGATCKDILGEPVFSVTGRVSSSASELTLSIPDGAPEGTVIRYTLNGKEPSPASQLYTGPIKLSGTAVVRARMFCDGYLSPRSTTHSYIRHPRNLTLPLVSIVTDDSYFYSDTEGIYVEGKYSPGKPNYEYDWRRPINIEYFDGADTESAINQLCETRVKGGATRNSARKSLAVYANKRFGTKRFEYEFFPDQTPGISEFKSFELRNAGNDFDYMYMRDAVIQQCMGMNADLDWQPSRPAIVYINGKYIGILNIRPRSNEDYVYSYYDGLEDIDMFENWGELKEGTKDSFDAFVNFYYATGHTFDEFETWMDTREFCNLMIMNIFFDNKDFPGNNIIMWRPQADGGRWRWVAKDTDFGMGLYGERYNYPTLNWITTPGYDNKRNDWANQAQHSRLFRRLLDTDEFKDMFIDRSAVYLGDFLKANDIIDRINSRYNEISYEYKFHREQINPWWPVHSQEVENAKNWTRQRWGFFYTHLASFFNLKSPVAMTIDKGKANGRTLVINDIPLRADEFDGKYFPQRRLTVKSISDTDGLYVHGWEVKVTNGAAVTTDIYPTETLSIEMPEGSKVEITTILSTEPASVDAIYADTDPSLPCEVYDLSGRRLGTSTNHLTPGIYLIRQGNTVRKTAIR